jgi:hypothetical protein
VSSSKSWKRAFQTEEKQLPVGELFNGSESAQSKPPEVSSSQNGQLAQMERLGVSVDSDCLPSEHRGSRRSQEQTQVSDLRWLYKSRY